MGQNDRGCVRLQLPGNVHWNVDQQDARHARVQLGELYRHSGPSRSCKTIHQTVFAFEVGLAILFECSWKMYDWDIFSSFKSMTHTLFVCVFFEVAEMNAFFLKSVLWVQPDVWFDDRK